MSSNGAVMLRSPSAPHAFNDPPAGASATTAFDFGDAHGVLLSTAARIRRQQAAGDDPRERACWIELAARRGEYPVATHRVPDERDAGRIDAAFESPSVRGRCPCDKGDVERSPQGRLGEALRSVIGGSA